MSQNAPSILVVDDDHQLARMVAELLATEGYLCRTAHDGDEALAHIEKQLPDLVVLDVMMPKRDGLATLTAIREVSQVPVIMLTAMGDEQDRILGLAQGADDYLPKPFAPRELLLRIAAILRRTRDHAVSIKDPERHVTAGALTVWPGKHEVMLDNHVLQLTGAELRILESLAANDGDVVSREYLNEYALGRALNPLDRALDTHISHLRRKLKNAGTSANCEIRSVRGAGYILVTK
ncbi:MAG: response regulator transcription factor [Gammaproteobacteria bacterium]|nr:response regulator transcription factor [Gammaproteobacteria bacterium]NNF61726.1 response regulator transcription factor [Gammaproteobacteria bacterium]NNM19707.1 response regulator transcription factor [Gammaproteobacteria bacterium]